MADTSAGRFFYPSNQSNMTTVSEGDLGGGIDAKSAESKIASGRVESCVNGETNAQGTVKKRNGYQGYAGMIPFRVSALTQFDDGTVGHTDNTLTFELPDGVNTFDIASSPLLVYGKESGLATSPFATSSYSYFTAFTPSFRKKLEDSGNALALGSEHSFNTPYVFANVAILPSTSLTSYEVVIPQSLSIDKSTYAITVGYDVSEDKECLAYYQDKHAVGGSSFVGTYSLTLNNESIIIPQSTHGLSNFNIVGRIFKDTGVALEQMLPDTFRFDAGNGFSNVEILFNHDFSVDNTDIVVVLSQVPSTQILSSTVPASSSYSFIISNPTTPFIMASCYISDNTVFPHFYRTEVIPDSIIYNQLSNEVIVTITNTSASPITAYLHYDYGQVKSNSVTVSYPHAITNGTSTDVALTLWGIDHAAAYDNYKLKQGWSNHLDTYLSANEKHLVSGLGGSLFSSDPNDLPTDFAPTLYPHISSRLDVAYKIAPAFWDNVEVPDGAVAASIRDRAVLTFDDALSHWAHIESIQWMTGSTMRATVFVPSWSIQNGATLGDVMSVPDLVTIEGTGYKYNSGNFNLLASGVVDSDHIYIEYTNTLISNSDYNETEIAASVGIFTDAINISSSSLKSGDRIFSDRFDEGDGLVVHLNSNAYARNIWISNIINSYSLEVGLRIGAIRTTDVLPLATAAGVASVDNIVIGDQLLYAPYNRYLTVKSVDTANKTVTVDEAVEFSDVNLNAQSVSVPLRWFPIEVPVATQARVPAPTPFLFNDGTYVNQPTLRSTMVNDCMFLTNGTDPVMKCDGASNYRAGFVRWQPGSFMTIESGGGIPVTRPAYSVASYSGAVLTMSTVGDAAAFVPGDRVVFSREPAVIHTVASIDVTNMLVFLTVAVSATPGAGTLIAATQYSYYFRLNAVDRNNNVVASAATGIGDFIATLTASSTIHFKLIGMPTFDAFDYDRLEIEMYRTKQNRLAPYYRVQTLRIPYTLDSQYITVKDTAEDAALVDLDAVNSALLGTEVGTAWEGPVRAKYLTSIANRLVLANITDWQTFDIRLTPTTKAPASYALMTGSGTPANGMKVIFYPDSTLSNPVTYMFVDNSLAKTITVYGAGVDANHTAVTCVGHGLQVGDRVYLYCAAVVDKNLPDYMGHYVVTKRTSADIFEIAAPYTSTFTLPALHADRFVFAPTHTFVPVLLATDGNFSQSNEAITTSPGCITNAMRRLAIAINSTGKSPMWLTAGAGSDFNGDQIVVRKPVSDGDTMYANITFNGADFNAYINGRAVNTTATGTETAALERKFGSRIVMSYPNFPEIFDAPTVDLDKTSDSAIDINPADGQEITAVIPFFGQSAFGAALTDGPLLVLKTNSVYVVDIATKAVKKLDTRGVGCTLPYSVASSAKGIMFANDSGVYQISRDLSLKYIGFNIERIWQQQVDKSLSIATGHHFAIGSAYKLSVPTIEDGTGKNALTLVYDHTREDLALTAPGTGDGAWTEHDSIPATAWCNFGENEFYGRTDGRVWIRRNAGDASDYRDGDQPITFTLILRAMDFGASGIRKTVRRVVTHFRTLMNAVSTKVYESFDMGNHFVALDDIKVRHNDTVDGLSTLYDKKIYSVVSTPEASRCQFFQLKYENAAIDEGIELVGVDFRVKALSSSGITQAAKS